jgi:hypothetical protein
MRAALAVVVALGLVAQVRADGPAAVDPHARVRPMSRRVEQVMARGMDRSATFRRLVRRIEASDVIVYVETRRDLRAGVGATMRFVTCSASDRFVRVLLNGDYNEHTLVALLGHELQHVVEVAENAGIRSPDDLRAFYRRAGLRTGPDSFDSAAARQTGYVVRDELSARPGEMRLARAGAPDEARLLEGSSIVSDVH